VGTERILEAWPSRTRVWTWTALFLSVLFFAAMLALNYSQSWTAAERLYLSDYLKSGARGQASAQSQSRYTLLEGLNAKGQMLLVVDDEVQAVRTSPMAQVALS
jgi:hypothetical protein